MKKNTFVIWWVWLCAAALIWISFFINSNPTFSQKDAKTVIIEKLNNDITQAENEMLELYLTYSDHKDYVTQQIELSQQHYAAYLSWRAWVEDLYAQKQSLFSGFDTAFSSDRELSQN